MGCGYGWSSIGLARAYPGVTVDGYDVDEPSVVAARRNATEAGVADQMTFSTADVGALTDDRAGSYDVVFAFECVHDMPDPVSVLAAMRRMVADDGVVVVMDERTEDAFRAPAPEVEQLLYGYSLMCCLGDGLSHQPSVGTGTVMRPDTFTDYRAGRGLRGRRHPPHRGRLLPLLPPPPLTRVAHPPNDFPREIGRSHDQIRGGNRGGVRQSVSQSMSWRDAWSPSSSAGYEPDHGASWVQSGCLVRRPSSRVTSPSTSMPTTSATK